MSRSQRNKPKQVSLIHVTLLCALYQFCLFSTQVYLDMKIERGLWLFLFNHQLYHSQINGYVGNSAEPSPTIVSNKKESKNYNKKILLKSIKFMTTPAQLLDNSLLVIWNDRNADRRLEVMKKTYAPDIHFYEFNTGKAIVGHKAINELISKLQKEWPLESRFELNKPSQVNHQVQIASWTLGPHGAPPFATGMDVAVIENDLIKSFYLFFDTPEKSK